MQRATISGTYVATETGMVELEVRNWRETSAQKYENYFDNIRVTQVNANFEAGVRELSAAEGGVFELEIDAGPDYAHEMFIILQGVSGMDPGIDKPGSDVHIPLNFDTWTHIGFSLNPYWVNFFGTFDSMGCASSRMSTFGPQTSAEGLAIYAVAYVVSKPMATNPAIMFLLP